MGLSSYYIPRRENTPSGVTHRDTSQKATIWSLEQGNQNIRKILQILRNRTFFLLYSKVSQITLTGKTQLDTIHRVTIWYLELGSIKELWMKLIELGKITKILDKQ